MSLDFVSWLAAILVMSVVVTKMLSGNSIGSQKREISQLEKQRDQVREKLEEARKQRALVDENLEFYERRLVEYHDDMEDLRSELAILEAAARKHLEALGYDDAFIDEAISTGELPEDAIAGEEAPPGDPGSHVDGELLGDTEPEPTPSPQTEPADEFQHPDAALDPDAALAVVPPTGRHPDRLFLPDAIVTELLSNGVNVIDRSVLAERVRDGGEDLDSILESEQYFRLGEVIDLKALVVVNSTMRGSGVGSATCRIVELPSGKILLSNSYEQPGQSDQSPDFEPLTRSAHTLAEAILGIIQA